MLAYLLFNNDLPSVWSWSIDRSPSGSVHVAGHLDAHDSVAEIHTALREWATALKDPTLQLDASQHNGGHFQVTGTFYVTPIRIWTAVRSDQLADAAALLAADDTTTNGETR